MRKIFLLLPVLALSAAMGLAQTPPDRNPSRSDTDGPVSNQPVRSSGSWGWLGLIGLFGLAGMRGPRAEKRDDIRMRQAA